MQEKNEQKYKLNEFVENFINEDEMGGYWEQVDNKIKNQLIFTREYIERQQIIRDIGKRSSSFWSEENIFINSRQNSIEKLPQFLKEEQSGNNVEIKMESQNNEMEDEINKIENSKSLNDLKSILPHTEISVLQQREQLEKNQKIKKIRQTGCNCRKSKCLKMYCQCFRLQIFCSDNCSCVTCGNMETTHNHNQAVIEALTRNPKAFNKQNPQNQAMFKLSVGLLEVKKGCRCKKTKCIKKYCQCFNSGVGCGIFCKCQECYNNKS